jgi:hypothetical protein
MKTHYEVATYSLEIRPIKVVKETEHTVTILRKNWGNQEIEERRNKNTSYYKIYPTFQMARDALLARLESKRESLALQSKRNEKDFREVLEMTECTEEVK